MQIRHLSEKRKKEISSLAKKKGRKMHQQVLIEGLRSVDAAIAAGAPVREVLLTDRHVANDTILAQLHKLDVDVYQVPEKTIKQISTVETDQGILAIDQ